VRFYWVDVFAIGRYTGNPLAVFPEAAATSDARMQQIAREIGCSETAFATADPTGSSDCRLRIFTPQRELAFAGHPALGTAYVWQWAFPAAPREAIAMQLPAGRFRIRCESGAEGPIYWLPQASPHFGDPLPAERAAAALGLAPGDLDARFPVQVVSTGTPFILVPVGDRAALERIQLDRARYEALVEGATAEAILAFCPDPRADCELSARAFAPRWGIAEDPATGSANGCLAAYLVAHAYWGRSEIAARVAQGEAMGRPSRLQLYARTTPTGIESAVGGRVVAVARGHWL